MNIQITRRNNEYSNIQPSNVNKYDQMNGKGKTEQSLQPDKPPCHDSCWNIAAGIAPGQFTG